MNYFNLETSSEEDEDEKKSTLDNQKWDWDKPENFNLYYTYTNKRKLEKQVEISSSKRSTLDLKIQKSEIDNLIYTLNGHKSGVNRINWAKKQENQNFLISCSYDSSVILWDLKRQIPKKFSIHSKFVRNAIFDLIETNSISISYDQTSCVTNLETGIVKEKYSHDDILTSVCTHPRNENLILIGSKDQVLLWDLISSKVVKKYKTKSYIGLIQDIMFINESEFVTCGDVVSKDSAEYSIIVWDLNSTAVISNQIFHEKFICTNLKKHPFNSLFYAQTHGDYIAEFSSRSPFKMNKHRRFECKGHSTQGYSIGFDLNSNGTLIASGSTDGSVYVYNTSSSNLIKKIDYNDKEVMKPQSLDVKFKVTDDLIAVAYSNGLIKVYNF